MSTVTMFSIHTAVCIEISLIEIYKILNGVYNIP